MNIQEIMQRIDYSSPIVQVASFSLSSGGSDQQKINIGFQSIFVNNVYLSAIDDDGQVLLETQYAAEDWFYIQIRDNDNKVYFTDPITLWALNKLGQSSIFRGWVLRSQLEMTIDITAAGIPAAAKLNDPISIQLTFAGYKLNP